MIFYDFEVFEKDWLAVFIDVTNKKEHVIINSPDKLKALYEANRKDIWVGFNNRHYDQYIMKGILLGMNPKKINDWIIVDNKEGWQYSRAFNKLPMINYDVMPSNDETMKTVGLKTMEGFLGSNIKEIDYVEIDEKAVRSYNAMFADELPYETQSVVNWNLKPDILIHGSPCQDFSIAGHQGKATAADGRINKGKGADEGSGTRSSLMWETVHIIEQMGEWKPTVVVWENVKNVLSKHMIHNFNRYLSYMEKLGYSNNYKVLDARDYGIPQARQRCFTVSVLGDHSFDFELMQKRPMRDISNFLESGNVSDCYMVTQPSVYNSIGKKGIRRAKVIEDYANTITTRQDRTPAQVIDLGDGKYRYLTELECWRLMGYSDEDYYAAESTCKVEPGKMNRTLYHQSGNSIVVPIFEEMFRVIISDILERKDVNVQK